MTDRTDRPLLTRTGATQYLRERGLPVADSTLAERAYHRRGPAYSIMMGRAYYRVEDLDAWLDAELAENRVEAAAH